MVRKSLLTPIALGYVVFFVLLAFAALFYMERTCYADIAFQTFYIINTKNVFYQLDRFGAVFIHAFPLAAVLLHLPLKYVMLSYSVAFVLQNIFFYWLLHRVLRQKEIALVLVLYNVLLVSTTFYWVTNEIKQGLSFVILFSGIAASLPVENYRGVKRAALLLLYLSILIVAIMLHNLVMFSVVFILGYGLVSRMKLSRQSVAASVAMVVIILLVKYLLLPVSGYESSKLELRENFITYFPNYFGLLSFKIFVTACVKDWYLYGLMALAVTAYYALTKRGIKLGWFLGCTIGYLLIVNVTHPKGSGKEFMESFYQPLALFALYPFVFEMLPGMRQNHVLALLSLIFFLRINTIFHNHHSYTHRLGMIKNTLAAHTGKFIVLENYYTAELKMSWGAAYESALLTAMDSPDSCRSFVILQNFAQYKYASENSGYDRHFYTAFGGISYDELNKEYFSPAPGRYQLMTRKEFHSGVKF